MKPNKFKRIVLNENSRHIAIHVGENINYIIVSGEVIFPFAVVLISRFSNLYFLIIDPRTSVFQNHWSKNYRIGTRLGCENNLACG